MLTVKEIARKFVRSTIGSSVSVRGLSNRLRFDGFPMSELFEAVLRGTFSLPNLLRMDERAPPSGDY